MDPTPPSTAKRDTGYNKESTSPLSGRYPSGDQRGQNGVPSSLLYQQKPRGKKQAHLSSSLGKSWQGKGNLNLITTQK